jgi:succinate dehydrogenase / fumarate reductase membrane anchor subunit
MSKLGSGTKDFIIIRVCGVLILLYSIYLTAFVVSADVISYKEWSSFFQSPINKTLTSAFFLAFAIHTWRGTWAVATDYLTPRFFGDFGKYAYLAFRLFVALIIAFVLTWSFFIIW